MIGEVLGSYRVIAKLGAGGMGTVWVAEHQLLGSRAAIKVLLPDLSKQDKIVQRFFDEARAATRIRDPGIVTVHDFGWHQGDAYIVMELLTGETLTQRLGIGRMAPLQAVRLIQLCGLAMAAAHARGIIHRDLKPDNIFVVADPAVPGGERIKLLDFGIAKLLDRDRDDGHHSTVTGAIMGTPAYMSPEQCRGAGEIDHRTDIYALGCVLFQLLCGRPPFIAQTPGDMIASQIREPPPVPSSIFAGLGPELDAMVLKCLAKDPAERYQTMSELVRAGAAVTGDNQALETIPPMLPRTDDAGTTQRSLPPSEPRSSPPSSPASVPPSLITGRPSTGPISKMPITTLAGSAASIVTIPPHAKQRYVWFVLVLLLIGGGITVAMVVGGSHPAPAAAPRDAAIDARAIDAAVNVPAAVVDAAPEPIVDGAVPRDAGSRTTVRPKRIDAGPSAEPDLYNHR
ncbi:MAG TPA: serine/threonine-protein kinase [Kofleriaceae bacterium]|nr:serine/threonine-protein kinase [Kofleriaceae bacterium]